MHRREIITKIYADKDECSWALKIFWTIYVLDRRWSFGTGMPFAIQDADIDPSLPEPVCTKPRIVGGYADTTTRTARRHILPP